MNEVDFLPTNGCIDKTTAEKTMIKIYNQLQRRSNHGKHNEYLNQDVQTHILLMVKGSGCASVYKAPVCEEVIETC